jgi:hypothetical protein
MDKIKKLEAKLARVIAIVCGTTALKWYYFQGSDQLKIRGVGKLASVRRWFRIAAIDFCLIFNVAVVCSWNYFRFLFVKLSL